MNVSEWPCFARNYVEEKAKMRIKATEASGDHPLMPQALRLAQQKALEAEAGTEAGATGVQPPLPPPEADLLDDPLGAGRSRVAVNEDPLAMLMGGSPVAAGFDPLSAPPKAAEAAAPISTAQSTNASGYERTGSLVPKLAWDSVKRSILKEFHVEGALNFGAGFAGEGEFDESGGSAGKTVDLRAKKRLQQLEKDAGVVHKGVEMSQEEYMAKIEDMSTMLKKSWNRDEKVAALKITIKSAKMLGDTKVLAFYPSMFVLLTEVLDDFGQLVFDRIQGKAADSATGKPLKIAFLPSDVPAEAKDTCRNWFFKTACIRELLPRLYVEMALLPCYRFLSDSSEFPQLFSRIASLLRGIGNPLVAVYARCYLVRQGERLLRDLSPETLGSLDGCLKRETMRTYATNCLQDYLFSYQEFGEPKVAALLEGEQKTGNTLEDFVRVQVPAVEWLTMAVGKEAPPETFTAILHKYNAHCKAAVVLRALVQAFDGALFSTKAGAMVALAKQATPATGFSHGTTVALLNALGQNFINNPPPENQRLAVLNEVWRVVAGASVNELPTYVACATTWLQVLLKHYKGSEVVVLLADLSRHISAAQLQASGGGAGAAADYPKSLKIAQKHLETVLPDLELFVATLLAHSTNTSGNSTNGNGNGGSSNGMGSTGDILTSEHLHKLLDAFKPARKVEICKELMDAVARHQPPTANPILLHTLFDMARSLHDSIDAMASEGERRRISSLVGSFVLKIDCKKDLEQQLNLYVECRAAFSNLDAVQELLVHCVASLAMKAHKLVRGKHSKKTSGFVKACLAYCHVTAPSATNDMLKRFDLTLLCAQVALANNCLPQTDTFLKGCISLVPDVPITEEVSNKRVPSEKRLATSLKAFLGFLVVVPGHPTHGPFYLLQGLLKALPRFEWNPASGLKISVYVAMLPVLAAQEQRALPYAIRGVESNDALYGGSADFTGALRDLRGQIMSQVLDQLAALKKLAAEASTDERPAQSARVGELACDLLACVAIGGLDLTHAPCAAFAVKLVGLAATTQNDMTKDQVAYLARTHASARHAASLAAQTLAASGQSESKALNDLVARTAPGMAGAAAPTPPAPVAAPPAAVDDGEEDSV